MSLGDADTQASPHPRGHVVHDQVRNQLAAGSALSVFAVLRHRHTGWLGTNSIYFPSPTVPLSSVIPYTHFDIQFLEKFGVTFRREGETVTLKCTLLVTPDLKRVQPRAEWYRDGKCCGEPGLGTLLMC